MFGTDKTQALDVTKSSVRYLLAAKVGKVAGFEQCLALYPRCDMSYEDMLTIMNPEENVINDKVDENQNWCTYYIKKSNAKNKLFFHNSPNQYILNTNIVTTDLFIG